MSTKHLLALFFLLLCGSALTPVALGQAQAQTQPPRTIPAGSYLPPEYAALAEEGKRQMPAETTKRSYSRDLPYARSLDIALSHPASWTVTPAAKPGLPLVLSFIPPGGGFTVELASGSLDLAPGKILTAEKVTHLLSPEKIKATLPKFAVVESTHAVRLDGHPALLAFISQPLRMGPEEHVMTSAAYFFISKGALVILEGYYSAPDQAQLAVRTRTPQIASMLAIFHAMARGITIWEKEDDGPPPQRIVDQLTQAFTTAGHPKTRDLELRLKYPDTWTAREGDNPHDVQVFSRPGTQDTITLSFLPAGEDAQAQLNDQVDVYDIDKLIPPGVLFEELRSIMLFGKRAGMITYGITPPQGGSVLHQRIRRIIFIQGGTRVQLTCTVATADAAQAPQLAGRLAELTPLYLAMVDSIALHEDGYVASPRGSGSTNADADATDLPRSISTAALSQPQEAPLRAAFPDSRGPLTETFSTVGHPKAHGTRISFKHPAAWLPGAGMPAENGKDGNMLQAFTVPGLKDSVSISIIPLRFTPEQPFTPEQQRNVMDPKTMAKMLDPQAVLLSSQATTSYGAPACIQEFSLALPRAARTLHVRQVDFNFIQQGNWVKFSCMVSTMDEAHAPLLPAHMDEMRPFFQAMADSITVVPDGAPAQAAAPTPITAAAPPAPTEQELRAAFWDTRAPLTQTYSTAGNPKACGIDLRLNFPAKWLARDLDWMANVQAFIFPGTLDTVALDFIPVAGDAVAELDAILSDYGYATFIPPGGQFQDGNVMTLGGRPAAMVEYTQSEQVGDTTDHSRKIRYVFAHGSTQVHLTGNVSTTNPASVRLLAAHMDEMRPLFQAMAESITFTDGSSGGGSTGTGAAPSPAATSASAASPQSSSSTSSATPPAEETFPWKAEIIMLTRCLLGGLFCVGILRAFVYVMDKRSPHGGYTGDRLAYLGLCFVQFLISGLLFLFYIAFFRDFAESAATAAAGGERVAGSGMWMGLSYLSIRRLQDIGWSPWLALGGLFVALFHMTGMWLPLAIPAGLVMLAAPVLYFIPGRPGVPAPADLRPSIPESPRSPVSVPVPAAKVEHQARPAALITLLQAGETHGPFPTHELIQLWDTGQIAGNASYWCPGMPDYRPLAKDLQHLRAVVENGSV